MKIVRVFTFVFEDLRKLTERLTWGELPSKNRTYTKSSFDCARDFWPTFIFWLKKSIFG